MPHRSAACWQWPTRRTECPKSRRTSIPSHPLAWSCAISTRPDERGSPSAIARTRRYRAPARPDRWPRRLRKTPPARRRRSHAAGGGCVRRARAVSRVARRCRRRQRGLRVLLLHVFDLPRPAEPVPRRHLRAAGGARPGRRRGALSRVRPDRRAAGLWTHGVAGTELERAVHPVLRAARGQTPGGLAAVSPGRTGARAGGRLTSREELSAAAAVFPHRDCRWNSAGGTGHLYGEDHRTRLYASNSGTHG